MHRISVLQVQRTFGFATHARQTCAIAGWYSVADLNGPGLSAARQGCPFPAMDDGFCTGR